VVARHQPVAGGGLRHAAAARRSPRPGQPTDLLRRAASKYGTPRFDGRATNDARTGRAAPPETTPTPSTSPTATSATPRLSITTLLPRPQFDDTGRGVPMPTVTGPAPVAPPAPDTNTRRAQTHHQRRDRSAQDRALAVHAAILTADPTRTSESLGANGSRCSAAGARPSPGSRGDIPYVALQRWSRVVGWDGCSRPSDRADGAGADDSVGDIWMAAPPPSTASSASQTRPCSASLATSSDGRSRDFAGRPRVCWAPHRRQRGPTIWPEPPTYADERVIASASLAPPPAIAP
jgi:hypothetical protein